MASAKVDIWNRALSRIGITDRLESGDDTEIAERPDAEQCDVHYDDCLKEVLEAKHWPFALRQRALTEIGEQSETFAYGDSADNATFEVTSAFLDASQLTVTHIGASGTETELSSDDGDYVLTLSEVEGENDTIELDTALIASESVRLTVTKTLVGWDYIYGLPGDCVTPVAVLHSDVRYSLYAKENRIPFAVVPNDAGDGFLFACDYASGDIDALEYVMHFTNVAAMPAHFVNALVYRLAMELALGIKRDEGLHARMAQRYEAALSQADAQAFSVGFDQDPPTPSESARG